jgi:hypothetical protein
MKVFLSLLLLVGFAVSLAAQTGNEPRNVTQLYGKQALQTIRSPDSVLAVLLDRKGRLIERSRRLTLSPEARQAAAKLLSTNAAYGWEIWKPCAPLYGARLIFQRGVQTVTVDFCFDCDILSVTPASRTENNVDFGPSRGSWLRLFKEQFPKDRDLKALQ